MTIGTAAILETACPQLIKIGDDVAIGIRNVIIGHFSDSTDHRADGRGATVRICNNVYLGPNVTVLPNVTIGEGSVVSQQGASSTNRLLQGPWCKAIRPGQWHFAASRLSAGDALMKSSYATYD